MADQANQQRLNLKLGSLYANQISGISHRLLLMPLNLRRAASEFVLGHS